MAKAIQVGVLVLTILMIILVLLMMGQISGVDNEIRLSIINDLSIVIGMALIALSITTLKKKKSDSLDREE
ncbi:hypothetical protein [Fodinibius sediminis]|nr:hypothetical protein [Fodinibius sediminis]